MINDGPIQVEHFPAGGEIIPPVLTSAETIRLLRLNLLSRDGEDIKRTPAASQASLDHLCRVGKLRPIKLAKSRVFDRQQVLGVIREAASVTP